MALTPEDYKKVSTSLDLDRAFRISSLDDDERAFYRHPIVRRLIDFDRPGWLSELSRKIEKGEYHPGSIAICDVPKRGYMVRPGAILTKEDQVVYTALIDSELPKITKAIEWSQGNIEFSYLLKSEEGSIPWFESSFLGWSSFREASISRIDEGYNFVVYTDISGYYEHVSIALLMSDLRSIDLPPEKINLLGEMLNRWTQGQAQGVPQGSSASDVLGKLYLTTIDKRFSDAGFSHLRYVDDFRIFCKTEAEARLAVIELTRLLRERGLTLQSAKTKILSAPESKEEIEEVTKLIQEVSQKLLEEVKEIEGVPDYITASVIDSILERKPNQIPAIILEEVYSDHIVENEKFDSTLFHYVINRMGHQGNRFALEHCLSLLRTNPEETDYVLKYLTRINYLGEEADKEVSDLLSSAEAVYSYQKYQILGWIYWSFNKISDELLAIIRAIASNHNEPNYVRSWAVELLARYGTNADLEGLRASYEHAGSSLEESEIIYGIRRMELNRRNEFYGRVRTSGDLHNRAVQLAGKK